MNYHGASKTQKDRLDRLLGATINPTVPGFKAVDYQNRKDLKDVCGFALSLSRFSEAGLKKLKQNKDDFYFCLKVAFKNNNTKAF